MKTGFLLFYNFTPIFWFGRVHHGSNRYCIDKNFGGVLIIWDRMFNTFAEERDQEKIVYGLVEEVNSFNPFWLHVSI